MKQTHYQAVVIGGGVVGASVLYHLATLGWRDVLLVERSELTSGSTWHAAADFHTLNGDPNVAALQMYTIGLYSKLQEETGRDLGLHITGGVTLAGTPDRWEWLQSQWAMHQTIGNTSLRLVTPEEIAELAPLADVSNLYGGMYNPNEGYIEASSLTHAYAAAARAKGAEVVQHNRVIELNPHPGGGWGIVTEHGTITADHVVNAGGLWARKVGHMAGVDLPVVPLQHHYLVTETVPELADRGTEVPVVTDLEGYTYARQEGDGLLVGLYELNPKHWQPQGAPWDFGMRLLEPEIDRICPELEIGLARYPCLEEVGIKTWLNGPFTFTPDGNPLVGPVPGVPGFWVACGVMAGFSQGGGVGLALAQWMIDGEPGSDIFGMDVARFGPWASAEGYVEATSAQFYARRFQMSYPNEELPAGRPLTTAPVHDELTDQGAHFTVNWALEEPRFFADDPDFVEGLSLHRSNAEKFVAAEVKSAREGVSLLDITGFSRYAVTGPGARAWLDELLAAKLPQPGRLRLSPMLSASGRLTGDLTATCWSDDEFWLIGSYFLRAWHMRWFADHLDANADVTVTDKSDAITGVAVVGPQSAALLRSVVRDPDAVTALKWMQAGELDLGILRARVARVSVTGELGYEINVPAGHQRTLYRLLCDAGADYDVKPLGYDAVDVLRIEKSFGSWGREFTWGYTPGLSGLDRFIDFDKPSFIGREAALAERESGPAQRLVTLQVDAEDADPGALSPIWIGDRRVGFVTSACFGHTVGYGMALGYVDTDVATPGTELQVHVVGKLTTARVIPDSPHDPEGSRLRAPA